MKALDTYDRLPSGMREYISNYGFHFSKKALEFALKYMKKKNAATGKMEKITPVTKEAYEQIKSTFGIQIENETLYDGAYLYNMVKTDFWGSSIEDDKHAILYVKDVLNDPDSSDESTFRCWLAKMTGNGTPIDWEEML